MRKLRIAQVCPYSLTVPGGVQGQVLGLARALRELGHEARVLAPCDGPPPDLMVTPLGRSVPLSSNGSMAPIAPDPACALRTIHALRNEKFDVLHLHEPVVPGPTFTSLFVSDAALVGTFHAAGSTNRYAHAPWLTRRLANKLTLRVAVSKDAAATAERNLGGSYDVLFNGIDVQQYAGPAPVEKVGRSVFFLGRHEERKGLAVLIDALDLLPADVVLWIAGQGPETAGLRTITRNSERIQWLGPVSETEKVARLAAADVFCAPGLGAESFGVVLLEAMAAGTPVVASDLPGYRNVAQNGRDAVLTTPGDVASLAAGICRVLDDSALVTEITGAGLRRVEDFSMTKLAEAYVEVYERALVAKGRGLHIVR